MDLLLGDNDVSATTEANATVTMHFRGQKLLAASLAKLAALGLSSARRVLLNGVGWGGTSSPGRHCHFGRKCNGGNITVETPEE